MRADRRVRITPSPCTQGEGWGEGAFSFDVRCSAVGCSMFVSQHTNIEHRTLNTERRMTEEPSPLPSPCLQGEGDRAHLTTTTFTTFGPCTPVTTFISMS